MTQINLLPWREQNRAAKKIQFGMIVIGDIMLALFFVALIHFYYAHLINAQLARNAYVQSELDGESTVLFSVNKKKKEKLALEEEINFIMSLKEINYSAVRMLDELPRIVPEGISLNKIIREGNTITVFGKAKSNVQITLFMENIDKSKVFQQPTLTEITGKEETEGEERNFQLKVVEGK